MFRKWQEKWQVSALQLVFIITTFAIGGSLCGWVGRQLLLLTGLDKGLLWILLYIVFITLLWPISVLLISIPLGQFRFFSKYVGRIFSRFGKKKTISPTTNTAKPPSQLAIFASGAGSNALKIIESLKDNSQIRVALIVCNKPGAGVVKIAENHQIPVILIEKERFFGQDAYLSALEEYKIDFIVLAGFLWKIPAVLIKAYPKKIINIHPALLPAYGGKGMYGHFVHEAVIANKESRTGISIHYVDELYDHGEIIFQAECDITATDTPETLASKIHALEHAHFPAIVKAAIEKQRAC